MIFLNDLGEKISSDDYQQLKTQFNIVEECRTNSCYEDLISRNLSKIIVFCSSTFSISNQFRFFELFFFAHSNDLSIISWNCLNYFPLVDVLDWSHPSSSSFWFYSIYFERLERRIESSIAYLRTILRFPTLIRPTTNFNIKNQLVKETNFYYLIFERTLNSKKMPFGLMEAMRFQTSKRFSLIVEATIYEQWNRLYQPFYRQQTRTNPFDFEKFNEELYTIVILTHKKRFYQLARLILHLNGLIHLDRILVLFNQLDQIENGKNLTLNDFLADSSNFLPSIHVEIVYVFNLKNNLNNRFLPWNEFIRTDCVLSLDDDAYLRHDEIEYAFQVWKDNRERLVGFIPRSHQPETLEYDSTSTSCTYSMILTGAAFLHRWYFDFYSNFMSEQIRNYVQINMN